MKLTLVWKTVHGITFIYILTILIRLSHIFQENQFKKFGGSDEPPPMFNRFLDYLVIVCQ